MLVLVSCNSTTFTRLNPSSDLDRPEDTNIVGEEISEIVLQDENSSQVNQEEVVKTPTTDSNNIQNDQQDDPGSDTKDGGNGSANPPNNPPDIPQPDPIICADSSHNPNDFDNDGILNISDPDRDGDGINNEEDICPNNFNPDQELEACECNESNTLLVHAIDYNPENGQSINGAITEILNNPSLRCLMLDGVFKIKEQLLIWNQNQKSFGSFTMFGTQGTKIINDLEEGSSNKIINIQLSTPTLNERVYIRNIEFDNCRAPDTNTITIYTAPCDSKQAHVTLEQVTIKNTHGTINNSLGYGVYARLLGLDSQLSIVNSTILNNSQSGLYVAKIATKEAEQCQAEETCKNSCVDSENYAACVVSCVSPPKGVSISNKSFIHNNIIEANGGGIDAFGTLDIRYNRIENNVLDTSIFSSAGAGINAKGYLNINHNQVAHNKINKSEGIGSGVYGEGYSRRDVAAINNISNNSIIDNVVETDGLANPSYPDGRGAGMFIYTPSGGGKDKQIIMNVVDNIISDNRINGNYLLGGGIYAYALGTFTWSKGIIVIENNTITHNALNGLSSSDGGGIYSDTNNLGEVIIKNDNVFSDNSPNDIGKK